LMLLLLPLPALVLPPALQVLSAEGMAQQRQLFFAAAMGNRPWLQHPKNPAESMLVNLKMGVMGALLRM